MVSWLEMEAGVIMCPSCKKYPSVCLGKTISAETWSYLCGSCCSHGRSRHAPTCPYFSKEAAAGNSTADCNCREDGEERKCVKLAEVPDLVSKLEERVQRSVS